MTQFRQRKTTDKGEATSTATTDTDDAAVPARDRTPHTVQVSAGEQPNKADAARKNDGKKDGGKKGDASKGNGDKGD